MSRCLRLYPPKIGKRLLDTPTFKTSVMENLLFAKISPVIRYILYWSVKRPGDAKLLESFVAETGLEIILHHGKDLIMAQGTALEGAEVIENEKLSDHSRLVAQI